ncbi:MAG TPA: GatB/YqeY domain-containing protein [Actinobacteria bacterium]|nr:GatB/YqeY domain-containing protein [Actinomycetota bacterium]
MDLKNKLQLDMKNALKAASKSDEEKLKLSTLRLLMAEIKNVEIAEKKELSNEEIIEVISRQVKKQKEAIESYNKAERKELAQKEQKEMHILQTYMPAQLTEQEVREVVVSVLKDMGAMGPQDMGKVIKGVMACLKGRADGKMVNELVRELIEKGS